MRHFLIIGLLFATSSVFGLTLDDTKVLHVTIGNKGLTRLSVRGDKIVHLFSSPGEIGSHMTHHDSGHVFISPEGLKEIHVTLMTAGGTVQDLKLNVKEGEGRPLVLDVSERQKTSLMTERDQATKILQIFQAGGISPGFKETSLIAERRELLNMTLNKTRTFTDGIWLVHIFEGENCSSKEQNLVPEALVRSEDTAISLSSKRIKPQDLASVVVIQKADKPCPNKMKGTQNDHN